jgi:hypothetical protein
VRFSYENAQYKVEFDRQTKDRPTYVKGKAGVKQAVTTTATIFQVYPDKTVNLIRTATVSHYHKDVFSLEGGRKAALTKAMYDAPTKGGGTPLLGTPLSKEFRTCVWCAYHGRSIESAKRAGLTD